VCGVGFRLSTCLLFVVVIVVVVVLLLSSSPVCTPKLQPRAAAAAIRRRLRGESFYLVKPFRNSKIETIEAIFFSPQKSKEATREMNCLRRQHNLF
jgi:hypothetical protein